MIDVDEWVRLYKEGLRTQNDIFTVWYEDGAYLIGRRDSRGGGEERWEVNTNVV